MIGMKVMIKQLGMEDGNLNFIGVQKGLGNV